MRVIIFFFQAEDGIRASPVTGVQSVLFRSARVDSEWGQVPVTLVSVGDDEVMVIDRHHSDSDSRTPPHRIEHRANVHAAASFQPDMILSINSVGSMREDLPPGTIGVAADVLDLAERPWTFHDEHAKHADRTSCFDSQASETCAGVLRSIQGQVAGDLVVAQCVGPQFETPSEIDALERDRKSTRLNSSHW